MCSERHQNSQWRSGQSKSRQGRSVRSSRLLSSGLSGSTARDSARAFTAGSALSRFASTAPWCFLPSVSLPSQETLAESSCRTRSFCSLQFECPPLLRARFRQPQVLGNARLPLDRRRRTDAGRHQESHIGRMAKFLVLTMSARSNESDSSPSEYASTRRRRLLASQ